MLRRLKNTAFDFGGTLTKGLKEFFSQTSTLDEATLEKLEECLLSGDLGPQVTHKLMNSMRASSLTPHEALVEAIKKILLPSQRPTLIPLDFRKPYPILVVGVNGSGKTTTVAKLGRYFGKQGYSFTLAGADTYRAAAGEQLSEWAKRLEAPIVLGKMGKDPASVVYEGYQEALSNDSDLLIIDTAGRLHTQKGLMDELAKIKRIIQKVHDHQPFETLLVIDSSMGRNAVRQTDIFAKEIGVSGIVVTKLDGSAKGGVILEIADQFEVGIRFVGVGESAEDLSIFEPGQFAENLISLESGE